MSVLPQESPLPRQAFGEDPQVLAEVLRDGVNLAVWTRRLNPALRDSPPPWYATGRDWR